MATLITVSTRVERPIELVWKCWTNPADIMNWNNASDDWYTPHAEVDLRPGGKFKSVMSARDKSMSFDFEGEYTTVVEHREIAYKLADDREVRITFDSDNGGTVVTETFQTEDENSAEQQKMGWQAILDNFKKYVEKQ